MINRSKRAMSLRFAAALLLLLLHATPAGAATLTVNSTVDAPDASAGDGNCAAAGGQCTLRAAVMEANALVAIGTTTNTINVPAGTFTLTLAGKGEDSAATGDLDVNGGALNVNGAGSSASRLDGNQADRVFDLGPTTPTQFSLEGATVQNGNAESSPPNLGGEGPDIGAGIRVRKNSGLRVTNAIFRNGRAGARGGAIGMPTSAGSTQAGTDPNIISELTNVTMENNSAGVEAGGIFNNRVARLANVIIRDNRVTGLVGNERGGGIANSGDITLTDVIIDANTLAAGNGGGIGNRGDPMANIFGTIRLNRVTVSDNTAPQGGGIANGNGATALLTNTTISGNSATITGGGFISLGTATLTNVTLTRNPAPTGGGLGTVGPPAGAANAASTLRNTIVADNVGGNCLVPPPPFARPPTSGGDNISSDSSCNLTGPGDRNGADPLLGPLADNGGFTATHALPAGSPAVDRVLNNSCPPPDTDQRGVARPQGARCDVGAYERVPPAVPPTMPPTVPPGLPPFAGCPSLTTNVIRGTGARDTITGTLAGDRIFAGAGADVVLGVAGDDCLDLGAGADKGDGGLGDDLVLAGTGNDRLSGDSGNDRLQGLRGNDRILGDRGRDTIAGGAGRDLISGGGSGDRIAGGASKDRISGDSGDDRVAGGSGNDRLKGGSGRDRLSGGSGNDRIAARDGRRDRISCGAGRDSVLADAIDRVSRGCERIRRTRSRRAGRTSA